MAVYVRVAPLLLLLVLGSCGTAGFKAYGGYSQMALSGTVGLEPTGGGAFQQVDMSELGLGSDVGTPYGRGEIDLGLIHLTGSGFLFDESGTGTITSDFGDITAGTSVDSELEMLNLKGAVSFDIIDMGSFRVSPGVAVDYMQVDMTVSQTGVPTNFERVESDAPVPMLFLQGEVDLTVVAATLDIGWMSVDLDDVGGTWWDIEGLATFNIFPAVELFAGYRYISADVDGTADGQLFDTDLELQGWTVGAGIVW